MFELIGCLVSVAILLSVGCVGMTMLVECVTDYRHYGYVNASMLYVVISVVLFVSGFGGIYLLAI